MKTQQGVEVGENKQAVGAGLIPFGVGSILCGIALLAICVIFIIDEGINALQALLVAVGSDYAADFNMPYIILGGGVIAIVGGCVAIVGGVLKNRIVGIVAIVIVLGAAGASIGPAAYLRSVLDTAFLRLQVNPFDASPAFTPKEQSLLDVVAALYNECCFKEYDATCGERYNNGAACSPPLYNQGSGLNLGGGDLRDNQLPVLECADAATSCPNSQYPDIIGDVQALVPNLPDLLCICYSTQEKVDAIVTAINDLNSCTTLRKMVITNVGEVVLPTTPVKYRQLPGLVGATRPALSNEPLTEFAVIGKMYPPDSIFGEDAEQYGWSCGLGYAKGLAFAVYLGLQRASDLVTLAAFVIGGFEIFLAVVLVLYWVMGGGSNDDDWDVEHYDPTVAKAAM